MKVADTEAKFEPFMDRLSRDIRNDLSETIFQVLQTRSVDPAEKVAIGYIRENLAQCYVDYIHQRLQRYEAVLAQEKVLDSGDILWQTLLLWDEQLFFEVHEVLEESWLREQGKKKLFLQAMIRAAAVYIKLEHGYRPAAKKIAGKAIPVLQDNRDLLKKYIIPDVLIESLVTLRQPPPKLLLAG